MPIGSYGIGAPYLVPPLFAAAVLLALLAVLRGLVRRVSPERRAGNMLLVLVLTLPTLAFVPALYIARFNLHGVAAILAACVWVLGRPRLRPLGHGVIGALIVTNLISLVWAKPGWEVPFDRARALAQMDPGERAAQKMNKVMGNPETIRALDREMGPGDVIAFTNDFGFPAVLWNEDFENRLVYVPMDRGSDAWLEALDAAHVRWVVVRQSRPEYEDLLRHPLLWQRVGNTSDVNVAFRRTSFRFDEVPPAQRPHPVPPPTRVRGRRPTLHPGPGYRPGILRPGVHPDAPDGLAPPRSRPPHGVLHLAPHISPPSGAHPVLHPHVAPHAPVEPAHAPQVAPRAPAPHAHRTPSTR